MNDWTWLKNGRNGWKTVHRFENGRLEFTSPGRDNIGTPQTQKWDPTRKQWASNKSFVGPNTITPPKRPETFFLGQKQLRASSEVEQGDTLSSRTNWWQPWLEHKPLFPILALPPPMLSYAFHNPHLSSSRFKTEQQAYFTIRADTFFNCPSISISCIR